MCIRDSTKISNNFHGLTIKNEKDFGIETRTTAGKNDNNDTLLDKKMSIINELIMSRCFFEN